MITIMIIAGESSGELYGSLLAKTLKNRCPDAHIIGIGGDRMKEAGVELVSSISDAFGLIEAISSLRKIRTAYKAASNALKKFRPDVLIPIDYPDFNLKISKVAKSYGTKILYYVSPQVWAWRKRRVKKIGDIVDRIAVLFPFEEKLYREAGVKCEFVGHPVIEEIESVLESTMKNLPPLCPPLVRGGVGGWYLNPELQTCFKSSLGLDPAKPLLSLLPGSRPSELKRHLPLMIDVIKRFRNDPEIPSGEDYQFCMPLTQNTDEVLYSYYLEDLQREGCIIKKGESVSVLAASDLSVVASGTATLQTAILEVPMAVVYKLSPITYQLGKRIVKVKHISLVNVLGGREVVKEFIQEKARADEIVKELRKIICNKDYKEAIINAYKSIKEPFLGKRASERVAEMVIEMAG